MIYIQHNFGVPIHTHTYTCMHAKIHFGVTWSVHTCFSPEFGSSFPLKGGVELFKSVKLLLEVVQQISSAIILKTKKIRIISS
jgi:hypothetical protein